MLGRRRGLCHQCVLRGGECVNTRWNGFVCGREMGQKGKAKDVLLKVSYFASPLDSLRIMFVLGFM